MTHTPGPWTIKKSRANEARGAPVLTEIRSQNWVVANLGALHSDTEEANARLIAAAPEMLEALKRIDEIGNDTSGNGLHVYGGLMTCGRLARDAIAKAAGK